MKKASYILILFISISIPLLLIVIQLVSEPPERMLIKSFENSGAKTVCSEISFRGKIDGKFKSIDDLKKMVNDISKKMGVDSDILSGDIISNDDMEGIDLNQAIDNNRNIHISAVNSKLKGEMDGSYITVSVVDNSAVAGLEDTRKSVLGILRKYRIQSKVNSCITGSFDGMLDNNRLNVICSIIFKAVEARKVEGMRDDNLISVSAYSPSFRDSVEINGNKVNLNFAVRYNSFENKTYIWLATPVITTEY